MWEELKSSDNLEIYANMINDCGCWQTPLTAFQLKNNIKNKINCRYFFFEGKDFQIGLSFKYNNGTNKMTWVVFLVIGCEEKNYPEALLELAKKTKEILEEYQLDLWNEYDYKELEQYNESFKIGYENLFVMLKEQFESIGMKCTYDNYQCSVML